VLNDVGALLDPVVVVLLIGERPGLRAADSLSAYLAFTRRRTHRRGAQPGVQHPRARRRAGRSGGADRRAGGAHAALGASGVSVKEELVAPTARLPR